MNLNSIIGSHIFVVEDDLLMQFLYKRMFSRSCTVTVFNNGAEALSAMQNGVVPDLIITDLNVPVLNGMELLSKVKESEEFCHIPVMMVSGDQSADTHFKSMLAGVSDYVVKPFDVTDLTDRAIKIVNKAGTTVKLMHA